MTHSASSWLAIAGLGAFHGLNPAMGWLFAVALALHRGSRAVVFWALPPILLGHAAAVALTLYAALALGAVIPGAFLMKLCGAALLVWAGWHTLYGHRHRVRIGMTTGLGGLALWSFLMAGAHGAGLMLLPFALPLCAPGMSPDTSLGGGALTALAVVGVHTAAMLAVTGAMALIVYQWVGVGFLRRGWINVDLVWSIALAACGAWLLVAS
jgi:hypothetical protein